MTYLPLKNLKEMRESQRLNQQELSLAAGLNKQAVTRYESGLRKPSHASAVVIARILSEKDGTKKFTADDILRPYC